MLSPHELEMHLLGLFYRLAVYGRDRAGAVVPVHRETGLPVSADGLLPASRALRGRKLALEERVVPRRLAAGLLRRPLSLASPNRTRALATLPPEEWTGQETAWVDELEHQIKRTVHRLAQTKGWFVPQVLHDGAPQPLGEDGLTECFQITPQGLTEALRRVRGTRYDHGPLSVRDDLSEDEWATAPQWARDEARRAR